MFLKEGIEITNKNAYKHFLERKYIYYVETFDTKRAVFYSVYLQYNGQQFLFW